MPEAARGSGESDPRIRGARLRNAWQIAMLVGSSCVTIVLGLRFTTGAPVVWSADGRALLGGALALVLSTLQTLAALWGFRSALKFFLFCTVLTWITESCGVRQGWYAYHAGIRPALPGGVPLLIPLTWFVFAGIPLVILAPLRVTGPGGAVFPCRFAAKAALFATCLTAYDLALEPAAVATGLWTWSRPGSYYGSPYWNLAGWWLLAFLLASVGLPLCGLLTPGAPRMATSLRIAWTVVNAALGVLAAVGLTRIVGTCVPVLVSLAAVSPVLAYSLVQSIHEWRSWRRGASRGRVGGAAPRCVRG